jgi:hypothetical protein
MLSSFLQENDCHSSNTKAKNKKLFAGFKTQIRSTRPNFWYKLNCLDNEA